MACARFSSLWHQSCRNASLLLLKSRVRTASNCLYSSYCEFDRKLAQRMIHHCRYEIMWKIVNSVIGYRFWGQCSLSSSNDNTHFSRSDLCPEVCWRVNYPIVDTDIRFFFGWCICRTSRLGNTQGKRNGNRTPKCLSWCKSLDELIQQDYAEQLSVFYTKKINGQIGYCLWNTTPVVFSRQKDMKKLPSWAHDSGSRHSWIFMQQVDFATVRKGVSFYQSMKADAALLHCIACFFW